MALNDGEFREELNILLEQVLLPLPTKLQTPEEKYPPIGFGQFPDPAVLAEAKKRFRAGRPERTKP